MSTAHFLDIEGSYYGEHFDAASQLIDESILTDETEVNGVTWSKLKKTAMFEGEQVHLIVDDSVKLKQYLIKAQTE